MEQLEPEYKAPILQQVFGSSGINFGLPVVISLYRVLKVFSRLQVFREKAGAVEQQQQFLQRPTRRGFKILQKLLLLLAPPQRPP